MSGSKASDGDDDRLPVGSLSLSSDHHRGELHQKKIKTSAAADATDPFTSPASPIPKTYDDDDDDRHNIDNENLYPSEVAGSSNEDGSSEPYVVSSMSDEDDPHNHQQQHQQRQTMMITATTTTTATANENGHRTAAQDVNGDVTYGNINKATATTAGLSLEIKPSTSSEAENKFSSNNISPNNIEQHVPVNFKKKELRCVTDIHIQQQQQQQQYQGLTLAGTGGSFSPLGSVESSIETPMSSLTNNNNNSRLSSMPKFYDSEEEGVGSLVLVPSTTKSLSSPRMGGGGGGGMMPPQFPLPKDRHGLTTTPAHLLPYQQRKKLMDEQQQQPQQQQPQEQQQPVDKRPPTVPPPKSGGGVVLPLASITTTTSVEPLPIVSNAELAKKYGGIAVIPPFRGGEGLSSETNELGNSSSMKKSKSVDASNKSIPSSNRKQAASSTPSNNINEEDQRIHDTTSSNNNNKLTVPILQEVIAPPQSPSPLGGSAGGGASSSLRSSSPSGESYHIRVSSCGSISSLGSMAVDSDSVRHAPRREHPSSSGNNGHTQQQQQHQHHQQQQYYPQMQPPPPPNRFFPGGNGGGGGYNSRPPQQQQNPYDLSQDIAHFLHGEKIASGTQQYHQQYHGHHHGGGGEYQVPPNYWNSNYNGWNGGGGGNPYQQQQHYPPPPHQAEPIPPPLTSVPNMPFHRQRLPSISDDDWSVPMDDDDEDGGEAGGGHRGGNNQQPYLPPPQQRRPYNNSGRDRMAYPNQLPPPIQNRSREQDPRQQKQKRKRKERQHQQQQHHQQHQHPENRPNERSSLLGPAGGGNNRNYDEYGGWNGNNPNTNMYYTTPPRRGNKKNPQETKSTKRKSKSKRRRREKEKLRNMYSTDSSPEEEEERQRRSMVRSSRRKKRHGGRKRRDDDVSDTISDTYSESIMSASLADRLKSADTSVNFFQRTIVQAKLLICNLPLSAAAISFSIVLLGIVWMRRAEEILSSCKEVNFHSSQCNFPEFPGCYFCDTFDRWYQVATKFHTVCSYVAGTTMSLYAAKAVLFGRVFIDEMSSPTTASPAGLIFMTMALAFTGKGAAGAVLVFVASFLHLALLLWFIYMSLAYQTMPDPSWFPNTIGIGLCAVKVWFYNPLCGHFLIAMTLMLTFLYYPISLIRVALNEKMSATICWMQMICPAISLYSLAIVMQPSFKEERPDISHFQTMQRSVYLPSMTCLFGLCIVGMISSLHGLAVRWKQIQKEEFTPAHAAYSFPLLMHALAVQAYLSSLGFFSETGEVNPAFKSVLEIYWIVLVTAGTLVALMCLVMYLSFLPSWIDVNASEEIEPPAPNETSMFETVTYGESLIQPYVSPTILQSNEAGVLVMTHDYENNWGTLVRTKKVPAVGFEPMMRKRAFKQEREALKQLVGGQDVIHEGDEVDDDFCFENVNV